MSFPFTSLMEVTMFSHGCSLTMKILKAKKLDMPFCGHLAGICGKELCEGNNGTLRRHSHTVFLYIPTQELMAPKRRFANIF